MADIVFNKDGDIDWNANGWPEPNPGADGEKDGYSIEGMPDKIFEEWMNECELLTTDWEADW